ncbi:MAG: DUF4743 domain-containing protein [Gammaproteobacteria bacterium]|nr:MAG: DUF4743 domain-containing protein [Gammaproteobacteria bacterium]
MALLDRIDDVNRRLPHRRYYRLYANHQAIGWLDTQLLDELDSALFTITTQKQRVDIRFAPAQRQVFESRIEQFFRRYFAKHQLTGWRDEHYAVATGFGQNTLFLLERAALSFLGIRGYGVHINGYVEGKDGIAMWIGKRALNKPTFPGKLDQIAAGGLPYNLSLRENLIKECHEEASIPRQLAEKAQAVSAISYYYDLPIGIRPDVIFNYDLRLPADFIPQVNDDEVDSFHLYPMDELLAMVANTQAFKFNSAVVIIDFAIRHGLITPEHPDYLALQAGMHQQW